jgi:hypothetical protein
MLLYSERSAIKIDFVRPNKRQGMPCLYKFIAAISTLIADGFDDSDSVNVPTAYLNMPLFAKTITL